jgi:ribosome recycling factor
MDTKEYEVYEGKMKKTINALEEEYNTIRAGRANPHILDRIVVNYYGIQTPLQQVGNISVPEARIIQIQPWDTSLLKEIEKAIMISDIGINPNNDGKSIRLVFPELTEERRKQLTKEVKKKGEEAKIAIRNIRRDAIDHFKKIQKSGDITEDDLKDSETDIQKITDRYIEEIDKRIEKKSKDILAV